MADRLGIPRPEADDPAANLPWLVPANLGLAAAVLLLAGGTILTDPELALRSAAAHAVLAVAGDRPAGPGGAADPGCRRSRCGGGRGGGGLGLGVDRARVGDRRSIDRDRPGRGGAGAAALYGLGLGKLRRLEDDWTRAARRVVPVLLGWPASMLVAILLGEVERVAGDPAARSRSRPGGRGRRLTLVGAAGAALVAAVVPGRDPLGLSERGRTAYVYGAEVLGVLLGAHIQLTLPWLFSGFGSSSTGRSC